MKAEASFRLRYDRVRDIVDCWRHKTGFDHQLDIKANVIYPERTYIVGQPEVVVALILEIATKIGESVFIQYVVDESEEYRNP